MKTKIYNFIKKIPPKWRYIGLTILILMGLFIYDACTTCASSGCHYERYGKSKYCDSCLAVQAVYKKAYYPNEELSPEQQEVWMQFGFDYNRCRYVGCNNGIDWIDDYCYMHACHVSGCRQKIHSDDSSYCAQHRYTKPPKAPSSSSSTTSSYSHKSSSSSTKMPDCDDYDNIDDFLDDWEGKIPGGIDAEDYWEDW